MQTVTGSILPDLHNDKELLKTDPPFGVICLVELMCLQYRSFSFSSHYDKNKHEYFNWPYTFLQRDSKANTE